MKLVKVLIVLVLTTNLFACEKRPTNITKKFNEFESRILDAKKTNNLIDFSSKDETVLNDVDKPEKDEIIHSKDETIEVSFNVVNDGTTYTGLTSLTAVTYVVKDPYNVENLSTERYSFSFGAASNGQPHQITVDNQKRFDSYGTNALAWDNKTNEKVLYLTFDCGYEYENLTSLILDTLKEKEVSAAFFCTQSYLNSSYEVVKRMILEGHIVGNHTVNHPSDCAALTKEELAKEILGVHNYLRVNFGYQSKYFRFPTGAYSQSAIDLVNSVGYRSIFWSIAHTDWDPLDQPGVDVSFETVTSRLHPGAVILLHTTSPDNVAILADFIDYARNEGYTFKTLDEYSYFK